MRVRASSLNYRDLMVLKGGGHGPTKLGVVPLSDGAGEVAAIGEEATRVKIGDRIAGCFHPRWFGGPIKPDYLIDRLGANLDGVLAEYAVLSEEALVPVPKHLSFEEAATLPCAAVTAWVALTGPSPSYRGRHGSDPGFGRRLGLCAWPWRACQPDRREPVAIGDNARPLIADRPRHYSRGDSVGSRADFEAMNQAIALHRLRPVIDRTFPFAEAKTAYRHFEGLGHFGKVVITHG